MDKRRLILDAAITVFARQGFHHCRVSDVADEAGVAYGLVYHYFDSKEEILNELFLERWQIMLDAIAEIDRREEVPVRDKLYAGRQLHHRLLPPRAGPDEGDHRGGHARGELVRPHPPGEDPRGLRGASPRSSRRAGPTATFKQDISAEFAAMCFYGAIEQLLSGWIFDLLPPHRGGVRARQGPGGRGHLRRPGDPGRRQPRPCLVESPPMENELVKRLVWSGLLAGVGALTTIVANRIATGCSGSAVFDEDPPDY